MKEYSVKVPNKLKKDYQILNNEGLEIGRLTWKTAISNTVYGKTPEHQFTFKGKFLSKKFSILNKTPPKKTPLFIKPLKFFALFNSVKSDEFKNFSS